MPLCNYLVDGVLVERSARTMPEKPAGAVRLVCISDTHHKHDRLDLPDGDVLVHAGDILRSSGRAPPAKTQKDFHDFAVWLGGQPHRNKVVVAGNHDDLLRQMGHEQVNAVLQEHNTKGGGIFYLENSAAHVAGMRVYGTPHSQGRSKNSAWQTRTDEGLYSDIPDGVDLVVSHGPPFLPSIRGKAARIAPNFLRALGRANPKAVVCGHLHWGYGATLLGGTVSICAISQCYGEMNLPIVYDLPLLEDTPRLPLLIPDIPGAADDTDTDDSTQLEPSEEQGRHRSHRHHSHRHHHHRPPDGHYRGEVTTAHPRSWVDEQPRRKVKQRLQHS